MADSLLFLPIVWILIAVGRQAAFWLRLPTEASPLEKTLLGFAFGLGLLAYAMLLIGLAGGFYPPMALGLLGVLLALGANQHRQMAREARQWFAQGFALTSGGRLSAALFVIFGLVALSGVYAPPTLIEWDSIAYHLADPKIYVQAHRIIPLPWEDHSNFAFNLEMCYTLGLLLKSVPLTKLFHFACAVGMILASYRLGAFLINPRVGLWTALLLAATPIVFWEAGTAYVDLGVTFYVTLTLLVLARGVRERNERWIGIGAVLMGLTLSTKDTALGVFGLLALALLIWRLTEGQGVKSVIKIVRWCVTALVVGCPWYVKSWVYTGNPVYPFFYSLFGGRYWNAANAATYDARNAGFGAGHSALCLLVAPWNLTMALLPGHMPFTNLSVLPEFWHFNDYATPFMVLTPVLVAALFIPVFLPGRAPHAVKALAAYSLLTSLLWFVTAQHVRYLLPVLPLLYVLAVWTLDRALAAGMLAGKALAALACVSVLFSLFLGGVLFVGQAPVDLGLTSRDAFLARGDPAYPAIEFINRQLPPSSKIVFYGNPLGFYCDRTYLWGEAGHSTFIPYQTFHSVEDLRQGLNKIGVTHILINRANFPLSPSAGGYPGLVFQLTAGAGPPIFGDPSDPRQHVFIYAIKPE